MKSLKYKIFLLFVSILLIAQGITFYALYVTNQNQEETEINSRLSSAKTIFTELFEHRVEYLSAFTAITAKEHSIKKVFIDGDVHHLLTVLNNQRQELDTDLAMSITPDGVITGQLQRTSITNIDASTGESYFYNKIDHGPELGKHFMFPSWFQSQESSYIYAIDGLHYQVSLSPVLYRNQVVGWLLFGFEINDGLADQFKAVTGLQTEFVLKEQGKALLTASSKQNTQSFSDEKKLHIINNIDQSSIPKELIATSVVISQFENRELAVYMYSLRENIVSMLEEQWWPLMILATLTLLASLTCAYLIAASISRPINRLVDHAKVIANGHFQKKIIFKEKNEIGQLANEFNHMQVALLQREEAITRLANHDLLTDLPNRHRLNEVLKDLKNQRFMMLHLNLRRLKDVNATLGYDVGDLVIQALANRLQNISKQQHVQFLVHIGADEFILIVDSMEVNEVSAQINKELEEIFCFQGISLQLQVRMGIALYPEHTPDVTKLVQMADTALHHTRNTGNLVQIYQPELDVNTVERLNLINDLVQAIPANQFELYFQPKFCIAIKKVKHVEALVRWKHPTLGMIPPDNFISIAEKTGQIEALTRWVFTAAIVQCKKWNEIGLSINIAVNISAENLKEPDFYDFVCHTINQHKVGPDQVTLEVTESSVVGDTAGAIKLLSQFKDYGLKISIDDYGTGYSSLAQLKQLPVHELKIDKSFIQRLEKDVDDQIIVRSTIDLAHNMGLKVVAEGIEDAFSLAWLSESGCNYVQGYYISRPKPASELTPWLLNPPRFEQSDFQI
ncbi:GGDEF domain-containing protein [Psychromonas sp. B3M02]|uniref:EAL domain-containing protein n=1 Tax=Psychromonas sp. B3M02 TaxID=2267226 RepID=UPI000DE983C7|nr:EAL domain-containing protein [Psychromonas sp. B3M02]RBW41729.1 GGDEF domain-containing protein [Psychromonas sp. B3M02]